MTLAHVGRAPIELVCAQLRNLRLCLGNARLDVDSLILPNSDGFGSSPDLVPAPEHTGLVDVDPQSRSQDARHASSPPIRNASPVRLHAAGANEVSDQALVCTNCIETLKSVQERADGAGSILGGSAFAPPAWLSIRERTDVDDGTLLREGVVSSWYARHDARFTRLGFAAAEGSVRT